MDTVIELMTSEQEILNGLLARRPDLESCADALLALHRELVRAFDAGNMLFVCGNGGSHADAVHIVGELVHLG